jgi:hypothetical protein
MRKIGPERPRGNEMLPGTYTGTDPELIGHTALMSMAPPNDIRGQGWFVQVDDHTSYYALGWWWFPAEDWRGR